MKRPQRIAEPDALVASLDALSLNQAATRAVISPLPLHPSILASISAGRLFERAFLFLGH